MSDCRLFHGWVQDMHRETVMVRASPDVLVKNGERFMFEVMCPDNSAIFEAILETGAEALIGDPNASSEEVQMRRRILAAANVEFEFILASPIRFIAAQEQPRLSTDSTLATFDVSGTPLSLIVLDVSKTGLGALSTVEIPTGCTGEVTVTAPTGELKFIGKVIYCRPNTQMPEFHRIGFSIEEIHRIDEARWGRLGA